MKKKKVKSKAPKRKVYKTKLEVVNIKMTKTELYLIRSKATRLTEGNVSAYLRLAALKYVPAKK